MDLLRNLLTPAVILLLSSAVPATPIDTTWDLLWAVESCDGQWFLDLLSESLRVQIEMRFEQLQQLAGNDPEMAEELVRYAGLSITVYDLLWMTSADFISMVLESTSIPPLGNIISEEASMRGCNAEVVFSWLSGYTMTLLMTWEEASWKVTGSSILERVF